MPSATSVLQAKMWILFQLMFYVCFSWSYAPGWRVGSWKPAYSMTTGSQMKCNHQICLDRYVTCCTYVRVADYRSLFLRYPSFCISVISLTSCKEYLRILQKNTHVKHVITMWGSEWGDSNSTHIFLGIQWGLWRSYANKRFHSRGLWLWSRWRKSPESWPWSWSKPWWGLRGARDDGKPTQSNANPTHGTLWGESFLRWRFKLAPLGQPRRRGWRNGWTLCISRHEQQHSP